MDGPGWITETPGSNGRMGTAPSARRAVICPMCGASMMERQSRKTGERFLRCSTYPICGHTQPIEPSAQL